MKRALKRLHLIIMGMANLLVILVLCVTAYSYAFNPVVHPIWSCFNLGFMVLLFFNLLFLIYWLCFHFRLIIIPLLGFLICAPQIRRYIPMNSKADSVEGMIKILSYNVMAYDLDEQPADIADNGIVQYIMNSEADIVCLQEAGLMNDALDAIYARRYPFRKSVVVGNGGDRLVCLSRYPILSCQQIPYQSESNGSIACELVIEGDTVLLVNNHLESNKLTKDDKATYKDMIKQPGKDKIEDGSRLLIGKLGKASAVRGPQALAVADYVRNNPHASVLMCGDFNDTPISYTHHVLSEVLQDAFIESGRGFGVSYNQKGFTFRIDHIMASCDWKILNCQVDNSIGYSDHYPIFCYLAKR